MKFYGWLAALFVSTAAAAGTPITLTSKNFDHDTQIGGAMTTGDWFVKFYAPWCGHCKRMAPAWEELAEKLEGQVNVAKVDCTEENELKERFEIAGFPTLLFFKDNMMYKYTGSREVDALAKFATEGYKSAIQKPAPPPLSVVDRIRRLMSKSVSDLTMIWSQSPIAGAAVLFTGSLFGLACGLSVGLYFGQKTARKPLPKTKKAN